MVRLWPERDQEERALPQKAHLLIVDDEANALASLARAFRLAGHEAMTLLPAMSYNEKLRHNSVVHRNGGHAPLLILRICLVING